MLGFLPRPLRDELLYSLLARYRLLTGSLDSKQILDAAFQGNSRYVSVDLPGRLRALEDALPGDGWKAEVLATEHTTLPYYSRLISADVYQRLRGGLLDGWTSAGMGGLSPLLMSVTGHPTLNLCPACVKEEQAEQGMSAWHRVHQLPGVFVCPLHEIALRTTNIQVRAQSRLLPCMASRSDSAPIAAAIKGYTAVSVAVNSDWLLHNPSGPIEAVELRAGVRAMLKDGGWLDRGNMVRRGLRQALSDKFGSANLDALGCHVGVVGNRDAWVSWLWEKRNRVRAHPLRYLLLLAFLDRKVEDLFKFAGKELPEDEPSNRPGKHRREAPSDPNFIGTHRAVVLAKIAARPGAGRTELRACSVSFKHLSMYDLDWLEEVLPPEKSKATIHDWSARDSELLPDVTKAIAALRVEAGRPVRITFNRIAIAAGERGLLHAQRERLSKCAAAMDAATENDLAFSRRRLDWAANEMVVRGDLLQWSTLATLGKLSGPWRPTLEPYARAMFERMLDAELGKPFEPDRMADEHG